MHYFYFRCTKDAAGLPDLLMPTRINNVKRSSRKVLKELSSRGNILFIDKRGNVFV